MAKALKRPLIGITMGDPVGVGPEIALRAFQDPAIFAACRPFLIGDLQVLSSADQQIKSGLRIREINHPDQAIDSPGVMNLIGQSHLDSAKAMPGSPTPETGKAMVAYVMTAIDMALNRQIQGFATGPINKAAMRLAGFSFKGHTELLSERTGTDHVVMMMAGDKLRVSLVTTHEPIKNVPDILTEENVFRTIAITHQALVDRFGIPAPRLAVAGLNPHAGEAGIMGTEDDRIIAPAVDRSRKGGYDADGPFPPDTVFYLAVKENWDAVICMYHDQGLIPFKMLHFDDGVNTTLGLPIIRTSVDHGTAYNIAGTGRAKPGSLIAAIKMAAKQAANQNRRG